MFEKILTTEQVFFIMNIDNERMFYAGGAFMKKKYALKNKKRFFTFTAAVFLSVLSFITTTSAHGFKEKEYRTIIVKKGDTLWDIASQHSKDYDIRKFIFEIKKANNLPDSAIYIGQELKIPQMQY